MRPKVAKFGGTSLADAGCFRQVARLLAGDPSRRIAVVSAPGRRRGDDAKVTDLLLAGKYAKAWERFDQIARSLGLPPPERPPEALLCDRAYAASRGEALCARLLAGYLGWRYLDAAQVIRFDSGGRLLEEETRRALRRALIEEEGGVVLPGFYGARPDGRVQLFPRGGSDVTGALVAEAVQAQVYENWTDVRGVRRVDPQVLPDAPRVERMSYAELRALASAGAQVLHGSALEPVERARIPLHVRCTFYPEEEGTWVSGQSALTGPGLLVATGHRQGEEAVLTLVGRFTPVLRAQITGLLAGREIAVRRAERGAEAMKLWVGADCLDEALRALGESSL